MQNGHTKTTIASDHGEAQDGPHYTIIPSEFKGRLEFLLTFCQPNGSEAKGQLVICCKNEAATQWISKFLQDQQIPHDFASSIEQIKAGGKTRTRIWVAIFHCSRAFSLDGTTFFPSNLISSQTKALQTKKSDKRRNRENFLIALNDLRQNSPVVHAEHGIGIFEGSTKKEIGGQIYEMLKIRYQDGNIYVPVEKISALSAHNAQNEEDIALDKISGQSWTRLKESTKKQLSQVAHQLIEVASKRSLIKAETYPAAPRIRLLEELGESFQYIETPDQTNAISDVYNDLESPKPMYRVVCGDVGFGKTEVAIRAAFLVTCGRLMGLNHAQVAFLCPTVMLAEQQFETIKKRLEPFGINATLFCSNMSTAQAKRAIEDIAAGRTDIVVGTSSILSNKITYQHLGLVICDEEHLFGVDQKEALLRNHQGAHYLALSATPIPRTLYKIISGLQDVSVILTPPHQRVGTKTSIITFEKSVLRAIVMQELAQKGQTLIITPKISYIRELSEDLSTILPEARIIAIHGEMKPDQIHQATQTIQENKCDLVIATTIIASGIDFSNSNTVIIHKPMLFGLSQLHQIRGRVGRRNKQGNCYLLVEKRDLQNKPQMSRLYSLRNFSDLGAGFQIAQLDLESRGGGNLISHQQSGKMEHISVGLYYELLNSAIADLQEQDSSIKKATHSQTAANGREEQRGQEGQEGQERPRSGTHKHNEEDETLTRPPTPEINIDRPIYIPDELITSLQLRIQLYRKIANIITLDELDEFYQSMTNRFGRFTRQIQNLDDIITLRDFCFRTNIHRLQKKGGTLSVWFQNKSLLDLPRLLQMVNKRSIKILPNDIVVIKMPKSQNAATEVDQETKDDNLINEIKSVLKTTIEPLLLKAPSNPRA